jgi:3-hydroxybutyryl-CoA dehydrogenase
MLHAWPFMDIFGLDVILAIEERWYHESVDERDKPPRILVERVKNGELGVKTGKGFYRYPNSSFKRAGWPRRESHKTP